MSTVILGACWPLVMSPAQKAVLISLADQASDDGVCWPAVGSIAKRTCLSPRAVQDAINWLETAGIVKREFRHNKSTSYTIRPSAYKPEAASTVRVRKAKPSTRRGADGAPPADGAGGADAAGGAPDAPPHADGAPPPADGAPPGVQGAHPEPSLNRKGTAKEPSSRPAAPTGGEGKAGKTTEQDALQAACRATWEAYCGAYWARYAVKPVRNPTVNSQVKQLVTRIGQEDAPEVAAFFVARIEDPFVVRDCHSVGQLLAKAEAYRTQWAMGRPVAARPQATGETAYQRQMRERVEEACPALARQVPGAGAAAADVIDIAPAAAPTGMAARVAALLNR